jgi:hypothetical protein
MIRLLSGVSASAEEEEVVVFKINKQNIIKKDVPRRGLFVEHLAYKCTENRLAPDRYPFDLCAQATEILNALL